MTAEILSELKTLSSKIDTIQSEISYLYKHLVDHLPTCQDLHPEGHCKQKENSLSGESETRVLSVNNTIDKDYPAIDHNNIIIAKPTTDDRSVPETAEQNVVQAQKCDEEEVRSRSSRKPLRNVPIQGYSHRNLKEYRDECMRKALQLNIVSLVDNLPYSENDILDMLIENECLTETECSDLLHNGSRKDCVRNLIRKIKGRSYKVIKTFLECVKTLQPEVAASIMQDYEKLVKDKQNYNRQCAFCTLKRSVDIKFLADHTWSVGAISDELYDEIVDGRMDRESLWTRLSDEFNVAPSTNRQNALRKFTEALMRVGQYRELVLKLSKLHFFKCTCVKIDVESMRFSLSEQSRSFKSECDENTTASPMSTPRSSRSIGDEINSEEDEFPINELENYFLSPRTTENDNPYYNSRFGLRKGSLFAQEALEGFRQSRSNSFGKRETVRPLNMRRASMFT